MKKTSVRSLEKLESALGLIEKLLQDKKHKEALAEIRDLESSQEIGQIPSQGLVRFHYLKACVLRLLGNYQEALASGSKAFSLVKRTDNHREIAQVQHVLGLIHVSLGNVEDAEVEIRDAMTGFRRVSDFKGLISALSKLAFIQSIKGDCYRSAALLKEALQYCDQANEATYKRVLYGNLGARYTLMGRWEDAVHNLRLNVRLNEESQDWINLTRGLLSLGYVLCLRRKFKDAVSLYEKALRLIYENNYVREMAIYYEYYGELAFAQGNYFLAKDHFRNGIKIGEEIAPDSAIVSQTYRLLAELQIAEREHDDALTSCEKALNVAESLGEKIEIGAIHRALGQIHSAKREKEKAKENFEKSISILEKIGAKFELGKAYLEAVSSKVFGYVDCIAHYAGGREIFRELGSDYHLGRIALAFCEFLFEIGEYDKAEVYLREPEKIFKRLDEKKDLDSVLRLRGRIDRALGKVGSPKTRHRTEYHFSDIVTQHPRMLAIIDEARQFKDSDVAILLEGDTGTGKDLLAKVIHCESKRKDKRFVKVNCAAIPETLLESELLGYKKGAFSGAERDKKGLFEEADGGTILLNEIGDLPLRLQAKILDVIEDKELTRLGEVTPRRTDFRVIAATNRDLSEQVSKGDFREDLYHRLNVVTLRLPPLRERSGDIPLLIEHFLAELGVKDNSWEDLDKSQLRLACNWPGNVRQLQNELKRLVPVLIPFDSRKLLEELGRLDQEKSRGTSENYLVDKRAEVEKIEIGQAIKSCGGDKEEAAKVLGISKATLYRRLRQYDLDI